MKIYVLVLLLIFTGMFICAEDVYKPYIIGNIDADSVLTSLEKNGFEILGSYKPYENAKIIVFTFPELKKAAQKTPQGIYGSVIRLAITDGTISYTNPKYWGFAYRIKSDMEDIYKKLSEVLGNKGDFGAKKGLSEKKLRKYHYMMGMPYFTDLIEVKKYAGYNDAIKDVEKKLRESGRFIYKIYFPEKKEALFGVSISGNHDGSDKIVMKTLNSFTTGEKHTAYLPYEIYISDNKAYILNGKFRIAISFPDLSMGQFMKIKNAPKNIKKSIIELLK